MNDGTAIVVFVLMLKALRRLWRLWDRLGYQEKISRCQCLDMLQLKRTFKKTSSYVRTVSIRSQAVFHVTMYNEIVWSSWQVVLGATLDAPSVLAFFGTSVVVQRWGRGRKKTPGNSTENSPENEQLEPKNQPEINQSKGMSNLPNLDFWGFHVSFRDPLEVQSTKTKCLVFRMIHGARIPHF